jgi:Holliday junction resolvase RusA-like endonuclease
VIKTFQFEAAVRAVPGSNQKRGFVNPKTGRVIIADKAKGKAAYTAVLRVLAQQAAIQVDWKPTDKPVHFFLVFAYTRPKGHFGSGRNAGRVKASAPLCMTTKPDVSNLVKPTEDALKGIAWKDDSQVVRIVAEKIYAETDWVWVRVVEVPAALETGPNFAQDESAGESWLIHQADRRKPVTRKARAVSDEDSPAALPGQKNFLEE